MTHFSEASKNDLLHKQQTDDNDEKITLNYITINNNNDRPNKI